MHSVSQSKTKLYIKKVPILWWTRRWVDIKFISRELTSVFVAGYSIALLCYVRSVSEGPEAFTRFTERLASPAMITLHVFTLLALLYHSITWLNLAPKAMVIKIGTKEIPGALIILMNYAGWATISAAVIWFVVQP